MFSYLYKLPPVFNSTVQIFNVHREKNSKEERIISLMNIAFPCKAYVTRETCFNTFITWDVRIINS